MKSEDIYWYWLVNLPEIGRRSIEKLLAYFDTPYNIYHATDKEVLACLKNEKKTAKIKEAKDLTSYRESMRLLNEKNVRFLHPESEDYPERLSQIPDMPYGLYLKGRLPNFHNKSLAIIGARTCTRYGSEMARYFGKELAACGINIISGLAYGIDGYAHRGAIEAGGYTMGVLGCGIDVIYPQENYELFAHMELYGGLLSESNAGVRASAGLFPQRNRLISGLADGVMVVEAMEKSGTFITVDCGLNQGKEIFAIPGRIMDTKSVGCNNLIKLGAHMVTEVSDVLEVLGVDKKVEKSLNDCERFEKVAKKMSLAPAEKIVYSCLRIEPRYLDDIISDARLAPCEVCKALNVMAVAGIVVEASRNYYAVKL